MGLNICTRWRAISARRSLRISSSLLPLNIGPQITSIQPRLPRIAFIFSPLSLSLQTADAPDIVSSALKPRSSPRKSGSLLYRQTRRRRARLGLTALAGRGCAPHEFMKMIKPLKDLRGAGQQPAAHLLHRHTADQVHRNANPVREGQLALRAGAAPGVLIPITDNRVSPVLDQIEVPGDDLPHRPAKTLEIGMLPRAKLAHLGFRQVLELVFGGIIDLMPQLAQSRSDLQAPAFAFVGRVLNGACEVEKHGVRRLSAIRR